MGHHRRKVSYKRLQASARLVVEAVRHLVANHRAHRTVVHGVVGIRVEKRRLQDGLRGR